MRPTVIPLRFLTWLLCVLGALVGLTLTLLSPLWWLLAAPLLALALLRPGPHLPTTPARSPQEQQDGGWRESWRALQDELSAGTVRAIGVSNFDLTLLKLVEEIRPGLNRK